MDHQVGQGGTGGGGGQGSGSSGGASSSGSVRGGTGSVVDLQVIKLIEEVQERRNRCDIRTKIDISQLTNSNLFRDNLAELAYFVQEIKK